VPSTGSPLSGLFAEWRETINQLVEELRMARTAKKWSGNVKTVSTYPPEGLFTKDPTTIARTLASKKVSPRGPGSGMRMLTFFINRAGKNLSASRKAKLQKAKELLSERVRAWRDKQKTGQNKAA
jgi:hypothetical protein